MEEEAASRIGSPKVCLVTICRVPRAVMGKISNGGKAPRGKTAQA